MNIGLGATRCVLPTTRIPVSDLPEIGSLTAEEAGFAAASGIETVGVFDDIAPVDLAVRACRELRDAGGPGDPDVLLLVASRAPEVLLGSDPCRVQTEAGFGTALAFGLDGLGCAGSSAAWGLARDLLLADPARQSVVIAHASRPAGVDRVRFPVTIIGDGGYATSLVRDGRPVLRAHRIESDGSFHDLFRVDYKKAPWYEWREECGSPDRYRFELAMHSRLRIARLVDEVLTEAGAGRDQVAATIMQNVTADAFKFYETLLGLPVHPVCAEHLAAYGHLGAMDVVLNLDRVLAAGDLREGDLVLVLNNSPVAAWAVTLWEV